MACRSEWPDPSEMTGTNTRTNMAIVFPGDLVELVSESISESVNEPESNPPPQPSSAGFTTIPSTNISTETEEGPQHILSHQIPKDADITVWFNSCMHSMEILKEYNGLEAGKGKFLLKMDLVKNVEVLNELIHQWKNQMITIGVVGGYNSGKSTLINGLLKCKYLPESTSAETALSVLIQHEESIHNGLCESGAESCPHCPKVVINGTEHIGQKKIQSALSELNEKARSEIPAANSQLEHQNVVLMANIPSLSCPAALKSGFKVYLVDNPGLGELNQLATGMAQLAVATSTAYIYTMDCESIELKEHAEVLKVLLEKDSDLLQSDRLVMVVTKCDRFYERVGALSGSKEQKRIKDLVCKTFHSSLQVPVPCENVIPISGLWQKWFVEYGTLDAELCNMADFHAKRYIKSMDKCEKPTDKLAALKHGSNYASLEKKIEILVQNCLRFSETKMKTEATSALEYAVAQLNLYKDALEKEIKDRTENLKKMKETFEEIDQIEHDVTSALDGSQLSGLKMSLEAAFKSDTEQVNNNDEERYEQFERNCMEKKRNGEYRVRQFLTDFNSILTAVNSDVMSKIRQQNYSAMYEFYSNEHKSLVSNFQRLNKTASHVCHTDCRNIESNKVDESTLRQKLLTQQYDTISTDCVAKQPILRCNPQDIQRAVQILRSLRKIAVCCITTHGKSDGIYGTDAFPSVSAEEEAILEHRLKSREICSLLTANRNAVKNECESFLGEIRSQFVRSVLDQISEDGKAYLSAWNANWKVHLTTSKKNAETQEKETLELGESLQKVSELSDYIKSLLQHISMQ